MTATQLKDKIIGIIRANGQRLISGRKLQEVLLDMIDTLDRPAAPLDIPLVHDATVTITQGGVEKGSFTVNQRLPSVIEIDAIPAGEVITLEGIATEDTSTVVLTGDGTELHPLKANVKNAAEEKYLIASNANAQLDVINTALYRAACIEYVVIRGDQVQTGTLKIAYIENFFTETGVIGDCDIFFSYHFGTNKLIVTTGNSNLCETEMYLKISYCEWI